MLVFDGSDAAAAHNAHSSLLRSSTQPLYQGLPAALDVVDRVFERELQLGDKDLCTDQVKRGAIDKDARGRSHELADLGPPDRAHEPLLHAYVRQALCLD